LAAYEISNHAEPGEESRHNLLYWRYGSYAGVGPGAHGRMLKGDARVATSTERGPEAWAERVEANGHGIREQDSLSAAEQADEMLLMGLRLDEGIDLAAMARRFHRAPSIATVEDLVQQGLVEIVGAPLRGDAPPRIRAAGEGRFILNALVLKLSRGMVSE
jgi:oxygen-independent coproporphyrinogen-3 oxidase